MISTKVFEILVANLEWPSAKGRILVKDMDLDHLYNAVGKSREFPNEQPFGGLTTVEWREVFLYEIEQREIDAAKAKEAEAAKEALKERRKELQLELDLIEMALAGAI